MSWHEGLHSPDPWPSKRGCYQLRLKATPIEGHLQVINDHFRIKQFIRNTHHDLQYHLRGLASKFETFVDQIESKIIHIKKCKYIHEKNLLWIIEWKFLTKNQHLEATPTSHPLRNLLQFITIKGLPWSRYKRGVKVELSS